MSWLPVLLADGIEDVIGFVVFVVVAIIVWVIQAIGKMGQQGGGGPKRPQQPPRRPAQARPAQGGALEDEIGQFLRQAAQRRQPQQPAQAGGAHRPPPPLRERGREQPVAAEVVNRGGAIRAEVIPERRPGIDTREIAGHAQRLGSELAEAERLAAQQRQSRFTHGVGSLGVETRAPDVGATTGMGSGTSGATPANSAFLTDLNRLLAEPQNLRQAILLTEVFNRPEERWA